MPLPPGKGGHNGKSAVIVLAHVLTYLTILLLILTTIVLSVMLKGAKKAHHDLWEELLEQEKKTSSVHQLMANDKVTLVEKENAATYAKREWEFCQSVVTGKEEELSSVKAHLKETNDHVRLLESDNQSLKDDVSHKKSMNKALARKLSEVQEKNKKLSILYKKVKKSLQDQQQMMLHRSRKKSPVPEGMQRDTDLRNQDVPGGTRPPPPTPPSARRHKGHGFKHEKDVPDQDAEDLDYGVLDADENL